MSNFLTKTWNFLNEDIKSFKNKGEDIQKNQKLIKQSGEGVQEFFPDNMYGSYAIGGFNFIYQNFIQRELDSELSRLNEYRKMSEIPEICEVIDDAVIESLQYNSEGYLIKLNINDNELSNNQNMVKTLNEEFENLFYSRLKIDKILNDLLRTFYIDGKVYYERIINTSRPKDGIIALKKLPTETMDRIYDPFTGITEKYLQYLKERKRPNSIESAEKDNNVIVFNKEQIGYIDFGNYGSTQLTVFGFLEKARIPYNQLKLLETSVIIYRLVRAPERFVFRIDTGNMPQNKAEAFVEKIKRKLTKKQSYNIGTGELDSEPNIMSMNESFFLPQSADGRGSQVDTIGGQGTAGFTELDDVKYFSKKLYRALKYPISRIESVHENQSRDVVFGGANAGEITRDEVKWAKFLESIQQKFCEELLNVFLLHLQFKGLKKEYGLSRNSFSIKLTPPSHYKEQMEQRFLEMKMNNYSGLSTNEEFSKPFLMKRFLDMNDEEIEENYKGFKKQKELEDKFKPKDLEDSGGGFGGRF